MHGQHTLETKRTHVDVNLHARGVLGRLYARGVDVCSFVTFSPRLAGRGHRPEDKRHSEDPRGAPNLFQLDSVIGQPLRQSVLGSLHTCAPCDTSPPCDNSLQV